ncbi:hypothetical protein [Streptomyces sp. NPDC048361]|uniref:hypothetical protein n=1 Tax=Streptomyces sp. NPDC048361 TaxID=3154720 RepID=UPI00341E14F9
MTQSSAVAATSDRSSADRAPLVVAFSWTRSIRRVPGIGTIEECLASASATCPSVPFFA